MGTSSDDGGVTSRPRAESWRPPASVVPLIDSHCHLDQDAFTDDRDAVLARARAAGVGRMITVGSGGPLASNRAAVAIAERDPDVFAAVAVHPHDAREVTDDTWDELRRLWKHPKVVAVGETGLDYYYEHSPADVQQRHLRRFVREAGRVGLPLVIHCRDAFPDLLRILAEEDAGSVGGVIHCFSGTPAEAEACLALGFALSFSGIVTFKTADRLREVVRLVPRDRILVETDAPFLAPLPHRGKRNEPALVRQVVEEVARVRALDVSEAARLTVANTERTFRLPPAR
ncbi:MAG: TatD family hydrolase [Deltaproteobacteria bacterium]|nr:TatD family hydrolase [Deltaproteobacteria bacterium]